MELIVKEEMGKIEDADRLVDLLSSDEHIHSIINDKNIITMDYKDVLYILKYLSDKNELNVSALMAAVGTYIDIVRRREEIFADLEMEDQLEGRVVIS